jgi:cephalosporin hydroxylase
MSGLRHLVDLAALAVVHPHCVAIALSAIRRHGAVQRTSELACALAHVGRLRPMVIVEIGSHTGGTLYAWARVSPRNATIVTVDLVAPARRGDSRIVSVAGDSHDPATLGRVAAALGGRPIDFLFIDGDHAYASVRDDLRTFAPLVRPGGLVGLHDIIRDPRHDGCDVWKLWNELHGRPRAMELVDVHGRRFGGMGIGLMRVTGETARAWV